MSQPLTILVVDDEKRITSQLAHHLTRKKLKVFEANGSATAFTILNEQNVDIALLDLMIPGDLNGIQILKKIKEDHPAVEVIMVSGQEDIDLVIEAQRQGAIDFVRKPLDISEIMFAIERTGKFVQLTNKLKTVENHLSLISRDKPGHDSPSSFNLDENEKATIEAALRKTAGNQIKAAELLGISRDALKHRIQKHEITIQKVVD